ncbi:MAG: hypothetical protein R3F13_19355 [Prosthecobacter sp.]
MTEAAQPQADPGRWIRAALVILPAGTVLLGIASFGIWQWKKDQAADRSFEYAMALRQPISATGIERHIGILREVLRKPDWALSMPAYLESTMGAENMGYNVRRVRMEDGKSIIDGELTGKTRPREMVIALVLYNNDAARVESTALAAAELLGVAHEVTGESVARSLRFAVVPDTEDALQNLKEGLRRDDERVMHLFVVGGPDAEPLSRIKRVLETESKGTRVVSRPVTNDVSQAVQSAHELKALLIDAAGRP